MQITTVTEVIVNLKGREAMASKSSKASRLAVKEMVEGWEGRKLPKNISMKALIGMVVNEKINTEIQEKEGKKN